jgi:hypothetical protein
VAGDKDIYVDFDSINDAMDNDNRAIDPGFIDFDKVDDYDKLDSLDNLEELERERNRKKALESIDEDESSIRKKDDYQEDKATKDIFEEKFNHVDVINKNVVKVEHAKDNEKIVELDKMDLIQFYEERFKKDSFEYQFVEMKDEKKDSIDSLLKENFKDFLIYKKLAGNLSGINHSTRIPSERLNQSNKTVEVKDDKDIKHQSKQIITHRNKYDEVDYIEVICNCGETTIIRFDYDENADYEEEDKKNLYIEEKEIVEPIENQTEEVFDELGIDDSLDDLDQENQEFQDGFSDLSSSVDIISSDTDTGVSFSDFGEEETSEDNPVDIETDDLNDTGTEESANQSDSEIQVNDDSIEVESGNQDKIEVDFEEED